MNHLHLPGSQKRGTRQTLRECKCQQLEQRQQKAPTPRIVQLVRQDASTWWGGEGGRRAGARGALKLLTTQLLPLMYEMISDELTGRIVFRIHFRYSPTHPDVKSRMRPSVVSDRALRRASRRSSEGVRSCGMSELNQRSSCNRRVPNKRLVTESASTARRI